MAQLHPATQIIFKDGTTSISANTIDRVVAQGRASIDDLDKSAPEDTDILRDAGVLIDDDTCAIFAHPSYHSGTRDHPFLDMSHGDESRRQDIDVMAAYFKTEPAPSPYLSFKPGIEGPTISLSRAEFLGIDQLRNSQLHQLSLIIGSAFGVMRENVPYSDEWTDYTQQHLLQKMVPSGGSRHPAELLMRINKSPSMPTGEYIFDTRNNCLVPAELNLNNPLSVHDSMNTWSIDATICMAVERAMYRYRDPRSSRALLVDAGHIDAQLAMFSAFVNWRYMSSLWLEPMAVPMEVQNIQKDGLLSVLRFTLSK